MFSTLRQFLGVPDGLATSSSVFVPQVPPSPVHRRATCPVVPKLALGVQDVPRSLPARHSHAQSDPERGRALPRQPIHEVGAPILAASGHLSRLPAESHAFGSPGRWQSPPSALTAELGAEASSSGGGSLGASECFAEVPGPAHAATSLARPYSPASSSASSRSSSSSSSRSIGSRSSSRAFVARGATHGSAPCRRGEVAAADVASESKRLEEILDGLAFATDAALQREEAAQARAAALRAVAAPPRAPGSVASPFDSKFLELVRAEAWEAMSDLAREVSVELRAAGRELERLRCEPEPPVDECAGGDSVLMQSSELADEQAQLLALIAALRNVTEAATRREDAANARLRVAQGRPVLTSRCSAHRPGLEDEFRTLVASEAREMVAGVAAETASEVRATTLEIRSLRGLGESHSPDSRCGPVADSDESSRSADKPVIHESAGRLSQGSATVEVSSLRRPGRSKTQPERKPLGLLPLNLADAGLHNEPGAHSPGSLCCAPLEMPGKGSASWKLSKAFPSSSAPSSPQEGNGRRVTCPNVAPVKRGSVRDRVSLFESKMTPSGTPAGTPAATPRERYNPAGISLPLQSWCAPNRSSASPAMDWVRTSLVRPK